VPEGVAGESPCPIARHSVPICRLYPPQDDGLPWEAQALLHATSAANLLPSQREQAEALLLIGRAHMQRVWNLVPPERRPLPPPLQPALALSAVADVATPGGGGSPDAGDGGTTAADGQPDACPVTPVPGSGDTALDVAAVAAASTAAPPAAAAPAPTAAAAATPTVAEASPNARAIEAVALLGTTHKAYQQGVSALRASLAAALAAEDFPGVRAAAMQLVLALGLAQPAEAAEALALAQSALSSEAMRKLLGAAAAPGHPELVTWRRGLWAAGQKVGDRRTFIDPSPAAVAQATTLMALHLLTVAHCLHPSYANAQAAPAATDGGGPLTATAAITQRFSSLGSSTPAAATAAGSKPALPLAAPVMQQLPASARVLLLHCSPDDQHLFCAGMNLPDDAPAPAAAAPAADAKGRASAGGKAPAAVAQRATRLCHAAVSRRELLQLAAEFAAFDRWLTRQLLAVAALPPVVAAARAASRRSSTTGGSPVWSIKFDFGRTCRPMLLCRAAFPCHVAMQLELALPSLVSWNALAWHHLQAQEASRHPARAAPPAASPARLPRAAAAQARRQLQQGLRWRRAACRRGR